MQKLSNRIRYYRRLSGLTQTELGDLVGVSKNSISSLERCEFEPRLSLAFKLADVLDCPIHHLFYFGSELR